MYLRVWFIARRPPEMDKSAQWQSRHTGWRTTPQPPCRTCSTPSGPAPRPSALGHCRASHREEGHLSAKAPGEFEGRSSALGACSPAGPQVPGADSLVSREVRPPLLHLHHLCWG